MAYSTNVNIEKTPKLIKELADKQLVKPQYNDQEKVDTPKERPYILSGGFMIQKSKDGDLLDIKRAPAVEVLLSKIIKDFKLPTNIQKIEQTILPKNLEQTVLYK